MAIEERDTPHERTCRGCGTRWNAPINVCPHCSRLLETLAKCECGLENPEECVSTVEYCAHPTKRKYREARRAWHRRRGEDGLSCPTEAMCEAFDAGYAAASPLSETPRIDLSRYVNAADISAADVPHLVVEKLQRAIDAAPSAIEALPDGGRDHTYLAKRLEKSSLDVGDPDLGVQMRAAAACIRQYDREHNAAISAQSAEQEKVKCEWQPDFDCQDSCCIADQKCNYPQTGPLGPIDKSLMTEMARPCTPPCMEHDGCPDIDRCKAAGRCQYLLSDKPEGKITALEACDVIERKINEAGIDERGARGTDLDLIADCLAPIRNALSATRDSIIEECAVECERAAREKAGYTGGERAGFSMAAIRLRALLKQSQYVSNTSPKGK